MFVADVNANTMAYIEYHGCFAVDGTQAGCFTFGVCHPWFFTRLDDGWSVFGSEHLFKTYGCEPEAVAPFTEVKMVIIQASLYQRDVIPGTDHVRFPHSQL